MSDRFVSAAAFERDRAVQAFPLGGHVRKIPISGTVPAALAGLSSKTSLILISVPVGNTLYVGNADQIGAAEGTDARALMFPVAASLCTFALTDGDQADLRVMGDADFELIVLEASTVGDE